MSLDDIYDNIMKRPADYIKAVKASGINGTIAICGMTGNDFDRSNGTGKSTILESIGYALYGKIIRNTVNSDKTGDAGRSIITQINDEYPKDIDESYAEWIFEHKDRIYRIKRGYVFGKSNKSPKHPILDFEDITDKQSDSLKSHRTKDTSEEILKTIGIDFDIFSSSIMFGQNDAGKFLISADKDRKDMMIKILHLEDVVNGCLDEVRNRKNEKESQITGLTAKHELMSKSLSESSSIEQIQEKIKNENDLIAEYENAKKINDGKIEKLSKTDVIKELELVKNEGIKIKSELNNKIEEKNKQISDWKKMLDGYSSSISKKEIEITSSNTKLETIKQKKLALINKVSSFDKSAIDKELAIVEKAKLTKPKIAEELDKINKEYTEETNKVAVCSSEIKSINKELDNLAAQIKDSAGKSEFVCDKCKSIVSRSHIEAEHSKNNDLLIKSKVILVEYNNNINSINTKMSEMKTKRDKIDTWISKESSLKSSIQAFENNKTLIEEFSVQELEYVSNIEKMINEKNIIIVSKKESEYKIKEIQDKFSKDTVDLEKKLDEIKEKYKKADEASNSIKNEIANIKKNNEDISSKKALCNSRIGSYKNEIENINKYKKQLEDINTVIEKENQVLKQLYVLEDVFGLDGIQTRIVNKHLNILNQYISEFLTILSNGEMSVKIYTNDKGKIDIDIEGNSGNSYQMLSGGEKEILRLSVSTGLALLSFTRSSQRPEIICLDEIFGPLDNSHKNSVFKLLSVLQSKFSRVIVISHNPDVNNAIPRKIIVGKTEGNNASSEIKEIR
jgi:DNA repair exonuclease SbcCD ATPase subunit